MIYQYIPIMNDPFTIKLLDKNNSKSQSFTFHASKSADVQTSIHYDDTVKRVKYKILDGLYSKGLDKISYEEIYLYVIVDKPFNLLKWYKAITRDENVPLRAYTFCQALTNWSDCGNENDELNRILQSEELRTRLQKNDEVPYDIVMKFQWLRDLTYLKQKVPLGNRIENRLLDKQKRILSFDECFPTNPFDLLPDTNLEELKRDRKVISMDDEFLFHYGHRIEGNTIYALRAQDILTEDDSPLSYLYFPYLKTKNIHTSIGLESRQEEFKSQTERVLGKASTKEEFHNMDIYYDIYENKTQEIPYSKHGIESYSFTLQNNNYFSKMNVPLESIFQNIHASIHIPYIEYHIGKKQDPLLRLYYTDTGMDGKKIPYLKPTIVEHFMKRRTGTHPHLTLYVNNGLGQSEDDYVEIILEQYGNIHISGKLTKSISLEEFEPMLVQVSSYTFDTVNDYLQKSGYSIQGFVSLWDPYLVVNFINYTCSFNMSQKLNLESHFGCLYTLLGVEPDESKKKGEGDHYRYKRVEHYQVMDDEEMFISQLLKTNRFQHDAQAIKVLLKNYYPQKSDVEIKQMMNAYAAKYRTVNGRFMNRKVDTLTHGGFPISFIQSKLGSNCVIRVSQIDMMSYMMFIPVYIDSVLQLTQYEVPEQWASRWGQEEKKEDEKMESPQVEEESVNVFKEKEKDTSVNVDIDEVDLDDDYGDLLAGSDEESDEDENEDGDNKDSDEDSYSGGAKHDKQKNPAKYFVNRIVERNPILYESMDGYESVCQMNQKRQPIMLTKEEKEKMDAIYESDKYNNKKPYTHAVEYMKDSKGDPYYFICPQYWCTQPGKERALTEEEAKNGTCGKIIKNLKTPGEDEYVYDRTSDLHRAYVPGFIKKKCYPCCFKDWNKPEQVRSRMECNAEAYDNDAKKKPNKPSIQNKNNPFILDFAKDKLEQGRVAVIPIPIQMFLGIDTSKNIENNLVKERTPTFLRYGVEFSNKQSFLAVFSEIYSQQYNMNPPMKVEDFREILVEKITLDKFVTLQNGTLVSRFQSKKIRFDGIDIEKYKTNKLYKKIDHNNESQVGFLRHTIQSYENFIKYLRDENVRIDHVFLWDLVCIPDDELFPKGLNLVILEMLDHDITSKVRLVCPTNHYRYPLYDEKRPISIIIKNGDYYELIVQYERTKLKKGNFDVKVNRMFYPEDDSVKDLYVVLHTIKHMINKQCMPFSSKSGKYKFETNMPVTKLYELLQKLKLNVTYKVFNYVGKIIALMVKYQKRDYYLPCFPSTTNTLDEVPDKWMDDNLWNSYQKTVDFLKHVHSVSDKEISCEPVYRIVENGMVVGVLTKTNQFVAIKPPIQNIKGDPIPEMKSSNYIVADSTLSKPHLDESVYQDKSVQYIHLENEFYNAFRTTVRILMALFKNRKILKKMENVCLYTDFSYKKKVKETVKMLMEISKDDVSFQKYDPEILMSLYQVFTCQTDAQNKQYCLVEENNSKGVLLLPEKHLLTGDKNQVIYYTRLADELIRYKRVQLFMFYPNQFLNIQSHEYQVGDNEFIILKSLLTPDYLKAKKHRYGEHGKIIPYEDAESENKKERPNRVTLNMIEEMEAANKK